MNYLQRSFFNNLIDNSLKTDIIDNDNEYLLILDLPDFKKNDIHISFENGYLSVSAKREETNDTYIQKERFYGEYKRHYYIGRIDETKIEAKYESGTLTIKVPKINDEVRNKYIEIK